MKHSALMRALISSGVLTLSLGGIAIATPCRANPCAPRSSRMNPCAAAMAKMEVKDVMRPKNYRPYKGNNKELVAYGKQLFSDPRLSSNGMSCNTCHDHNGAFQATFAQPYPHYVQMTDERAGVKQVHLDEMVQFCMVVPMAAKPLPWNSKKLAALTAYTGTLQKGFRAPNPRAAKNPCAATNPCAAAHPCATRNPCAATRH